MRVIYILILILVTFGCSKNDQDISIIKEQSQELEMISVYNDAYKSLNQGDPYFAAQKFLEAEILYPQSKWAPKSALMAAYSYYAQDYYLDAIAELERFIKLYPNNMNLDYAYYLLAVCHYEQIIDETKDLKSIMNAKKNFKIVIKNFPNTQYALDSEFKIDLIDDILASKEMYIGRYYFSKKKWIAAINRFRTVVDDYDTTIYVEEALHRLVEVYYTIGLINESKKYAKLLGYNYQSSQWYENSYSLFNNVYKKKKFKKEKENNSILNKVKSLLN